MDFFIQNFTGFTEFWCTMRLGLLDFWTIAAVVGLATLAEGTELTELTEPEGWLAPFHLFIQILLFFW